MSATTITSSSLTTEVPLTRGNYRKLFPEGAAMSRLRVSNISLYSMTRPAVARAIAEHVASLEGVVPGKMTVTDAFSNVGGAVFAFARHFQKVECCEINRLHCEMLANNVMAYGFGPDRVRIHCCDYLSVINRLRQDVVFLDPPWGGPSYRDKSRLRLVVNGNVHVATIIRYLLDHSLARWVVLLLPPNMDLEDLGRRVKVHHIHRVGSKSEIAVFSGRAT